MPAYMSAVSIISCEFWMRKPRPDLAASISAPMTANSEDFTASRAPATIEGMLAGRMTLRNRSKSDVPIERAALISSGSTDLTPLIVLISRKNTEE